MSIHNKPAIASGEFVQRIVSRVLAAWPEHEPFLHSRFSSETVDQARMCEAVARRVWAFIEGDVDEAVRSYRWMCEMLLEEEAFFRRHGRYRHASFEEVEEAGYLRDPFMPRYLQGLLLSQVLWTNHARVLEVYARDFLGRKAHRDSLLEVGPGHGLLLALATDYRLRALTGWDISGSGLELARTNLSRLGVGSVTLSLRDIRASGVEEAFDLVVASELLEHTERPDQVVRSLCGLTRANGRMFLNVPVNSPAPDHIYLWRDPEEFFDFVTECGVAPIRTYTFPMTGYTEERARRSGYTISCVVVGKPTGSP